MLWFLNRGVTKIRKHRLFTMNTVGFAFLSPLSLVFPRQIKKSHVQLIVEQIPFEIQQKPRMTAMTFSRESLIGTEYDRINFPWNV